MQKMDSAMINVEAVAVKELTDYKWTVKIVNLQIVLSFAVLLVCFIKLSTLMLKVAFISDSESLDVLAKADEMWWGQATVGKSITIYQHAFFYLLFGPYVGIRLLRAINSNFKGIFWMILWPCYVYGLVILSVYENWHEFPILLVIICISIVSFSSGFMLVLVFILWAFSVKLGLVKLQLESNNISKFDKPDCLIKTETV